MEEGEKMNIDYLKEAEFLLRILLSAVCGGVVGYERKNRGKGAGIRTHIIVAVASCLMMIVSLYGFEDFFEYMKTQKYDIRLDPSRVASQIVSGVGFLGAGMIFVQKKMVTGLTTAAGVWAISGIGMAIGGGMYILGVACSVIIVIIQVILHKDIRFLKLTSEVPMTIILSEEDGAIEKIRNVFGENDISFSVTGFSKTSNMFKISINISHRHGDDLTPIFAEFQSDEQILCVRT